MKIVHVTISDLLSLSGLVFVKPTDSKEAYRLELEQWGLASMSSICRISSGRTPTNAEIDQGRKPAA